VNTYLLVPSDGLLEVFVGEQVNIESTLIVHGGEGRLVSFAFENDGEHVCRVTWFHDPTGRVNPRARQTLTHLTDMHMIFTGPVMFHDVEEERIGVVVQLLSLREEE
jgi:hypothetical protein